MYSQHAMNSFGQVNFWPKINLILYPFLENSTIYTTIIGIGKAEAQLDYLNYKQYFSKYFWVSHLWLPQPSLHFSSVSVLPICWEIDLESTSRPSYFIQWTTKSLQRSPAVRGLSWSKTQLKMFLSLNLFLNFLRKKKINFILCRKCFHHL